MEPYPSIPFYIFRARVDCCQLVDCKHCEHGEGDRISESWLFQANQCESNEETGNKEGRESRRKEQAMTHVSEQMAISCPGSMLRSFLLDLGGLKGLCWLCHAPLHRYCPSSQCLNNLDVRLKVLYCIIKYHKSV